MWTLDSLQTINKAHILLLTNFSETEYLLIKPRCEIIDVNIISAIFSKFSSLNSFFNLIDNIQVSLLSFPNSSSFYNRPVKTNDEKNIIRSRRLQT